MHFGIAGRIAGSQLRRKPVRITGRLRGAVLMGWPRKPSRNRTTRKVQY